MQQTNSFLNGVDNLACIPEVICVLFLQDRRDQNLCKTKHLPSSENLDKQLDLQIYAKTLHMNH